MITLNRGNGIVETMTFEEFSRWMCFVEALHFIQTKAKELKVDIGAVMKPLAIDLYIKERYEAMLHDVKCESELGNL
jgi:hypothetical protein